MKKIMIALAAFSTFGLAAQAQTGTTDTATMNFIKQASVGGMKEVKTGKLAEKKASNSSVRSFGSMMVTDHTKANNQLMKLVRAKGYNVPMPSASETAPDAMLTNASGSTFDKDYVTMMIKDHQKTIALFQNAANNSSDPAIKAFAKQTLPVLQHHLSVIQGIASKMNLQASR
jgi:putative membrane protein